MWITRSISDVGPAGTKGVIVKVCYDGTARGEKSEYDAKFGKTTYSFDDGNRGVALDKSAPLAESAEMKLLSISRDHRETFKSKELKGAEKFVGAGHWSTEIGIDDGYTMFYFSRSVPEQVSKWVLDNRYSVWHLLSDGVTATSFEDLLTKVNALGAEWDDDFEPMTAESSDD